MKPFDIDTPTFQEMFEKAGTQAPIGYWIWDGIHPTVFGHELMAREWILQLGKKLVFLEYYDDPA